MSSIQKLKTWFSFEDDIFSIVRSSTMSATTNTRDKAEVVFINGYAFAINPRTGKMVPREECEGCHNYFSLKTVETGYCGRCRNKYLQVDEDRLRLEEERRQLEQDLTGG